jgi:hypothetical protein
METRTDQQNKALHKWFTMVSDSLNENHLDVRTALKEDVELRWSPRLVKEILWRETQKILFGKNSTTELYKAHEIDQIYEILNRWLAKHGIHVPFPQRDSQNPGE